MSSSGGGARGGNGGGVSGIPATSRKMVQSLKEIVNCPEHEIYAMLKECNMDPNDTVHRLLSQDPFHEVKSKRDKKKELKEASDSRGRGGNTALNHGGRSVDRHVGRVGSSQFSSTGILRGKPANKKDNGVIAQSSSSMKATGTINHDINRWPVCHSLPESDSVPVENKTQMAGFSDAISSSLASVGFPPSSQPKAGIQSAWSGVPGQLSMADIVKMGRPKASSIPVLSNNPPHSAHDSAPLTTPQQGMKQPHDRPTVTLQSHHDFDSSDEPVSNISGTVHSTGIAVSQHVSHDDWPVEQTSASGASLLEPSTVPEAFGDLSVPSNLNADNANVHQTYQSDEVEETEEDVATDSVNKDSIGSASVSGRQMQEDRPGGPSHFDNDSFNNMDSFQSHRHGYEHQEVRSVFLFLLKTQEAIRLYECFAWVATPPTSGDSTPPHFEVSEAIIGLRGLYGGRRGIGVGSQVSIPSYSVPSVEDGSMSVSTAAVKLQQLSMQESLGRASAEDNPAVIIPNHLQVPTADCSHLSFGSFGSGGNAAYPMSFASQSLKSNLDDVSEVENTSVGHPDARSSNYLADEQLQSSSDSNVISRNAVGAGSYDSASAQPEALKHDTAEVTHSHQYSFPGSVPGYTSENSSQLNAGFLYAQANSQMQNLAPLSSVMQAYTNSLQGNLLASAGQPARESDLPYSPFLATQSVPTKYSSAVSSISGPTISMPETVKPAVFSMQQTPQSLPGNNIATGPALPPHLAVHPYSQPSLPLGHFANMISYPFMHQSYAYMPSAFQQAYSSNNTYHQSPAAVHSAGIKYTLPQYKNSVELNSLPQSAAIASGHGAFGASTNIPGNFSLNSSSTPTSSTIRYEDAVNSQYKDSNQYVSLQNDNSAAWIHGPGSRTVSALPASTYYNFQGQNQQHGGLRQVQQPSQHYGAPGYPNFYHSQAGISQELQQQTPNDAALGASQGQQTKQSHQIWQNSY
ncbi:hypothetical protein Scep_011962 [Stephania cephalantha]|uniref:GBF-interacting protein 1 N-terminal domain-containing protein n=1 Tax=Stephania cephalantha TaxID=152367 RepID=A0AAP0JEA0_9MAGN